MWIKFVHLAIAADAYTEDTLLDASCGSGLFSRHDACLHFCPRVRLGIRAWLLKVHDIGLVVVDLTHQGCPLHSCVRRFTASGDYSKVAQLYCSVVVCWIRMAPFRRARTTHSSTQVLQTYSFGGRWSRWTSVSRCSGRHGHT